MNRQKQILTLGLTLWMSTMPVHAWQINVDGDTQQINVSNDRSLHDVDAYLVWMDKDETDEAMRFMSWTENQEPKWIIGLQSVFNTAINIEPFESVKIAKLTQTCPTDHRCLLALVAVNADADPLNTENWQAISLYPLSSAASKERLPGQRAFTTSVSNNNPNTTAMDDKAAPSIAPVAETTADASKTTTTTEKPDIFSLVNQELFYANGQAERFQVIDLKDVKQPKLAAWAKMTGNPREIYVMDNYYVLLQQNEYVDNKEGTYLTVFTKDSAGKLVVVQELPLDGWFMESRRRGQMIYTVTQSYGNAVAVDCANCEQSIQQQVGVIITALRVGEDGQLTQVDQAILPGYSPIVAIFNDYLVMANRDPQNWQDSQVQVFDLTSDNGQLITLPVIKIAGGYIPSEFHLSVANQQLRFVYGADDLKLGSSLIVYDLAGQQPSLLGKIDNIAPGEALFATRFVDNRAFVVTYERKDPLWIIDLTDPTKPSILGELHVPGWSEKLFFNQDRLFAVGIDDQPTENEKDQWINRVALSLFDVKDPTQPTLLSKFIPLLDKVHYSWSPATGDERALLLDWDNEFAALPINAWEISATNLLQLVTFTDDKLTDAGYLSSPVSLQRSLTIGDHQLAALSDEELFTLQWGNDKVEQLGQLELATNIQWLKQAGDSLWAAAMGNNGYYRLSRYTMQDIENPVEDLKLPQAYNNLLFDGQQAIFYNYYPLTIRGMDLKTGAVQPEHVLESTSDTDGWTDISEPLLHDGWLYQAKNRWVQIYTLQDPTFAPADNYQQSEWLLYSWNVQSEKPQAAATRSIPGKPVGFSGEGHLVTSEPTDKGLLRFNLLTLNENDATLIQTREMPCQYYASQVFWVNDAIYLNCGQEYAYPMPVLYDDVIEEPVTTTADVPVESDEPTVVAEEPDTTILKLNPAQAFAQEGEWILKGRWNVQQVAAPDLLLVSPAYWYYWDRPMVDAKPAFASDAMIMPYSASCQLYRLTTENAVQLLKELDTCYNPAGLVLTADKIWEARGFVGISEL